MPGGRLTYEDRQAIASGLADGLDYAEIARRLARPTSTVTREVARNGGPAGYRAEQAEQAATRRARRRRPASPEPEPTAESAHGRDGQALRRFQDGFAEVMVETGMPPMAARVLVCLLTSDTGSHTAAELAHRLRVSPASISKAVGQLEPMGILTREREGPRRRERYIIHDDVWYHTWTASIRSMARWAGIARQGVGVLGSATPAGTRLDRASRFFQLLCQDMAEAAERRRLDVTVMERPE